MMDKNGLKDVAYEYVLAQICSDELLPNDPIVEQNVSGALNISRTPVREALKQLEMEGLVIHIPSRGTMVKEISLQDINEIYQIRKLFEMTALRQAVKHIPDQELDMMEAELNAIGDNSANEDFYHIDRSLHATILRYAYNSRMVTFYDILDAQIERIRRISAANPERLISSRLEHMEIIRMLRLRDPEQAEIILSKHIDNVHNSALRAFEAIRGGIKY